MQAAPPREGLPSARYRFWFEKVGPVALIGHLDLVRELPRVFRRAGVAMVHTKGFHPKPDMTFSPALSLGVLSLDLSSSEDPKVKDAHIDRAQKTFKALLLQKLDDSSPITKSEVFYYLGEISHREGDDKKAMQMLERALDANKEYAPAKELLAKLKK